jgi:DNA repair exonuclease SbcCD nuclease subunit
MKSSMDLSKIVMFTDIHFGLRNNSKEHNENCLNFIEWMIEQAKKHDIKTCVFGGDWHHVRAAINVATLNYSVNCLKLINDYFDHTFFIIGNHDLYYRDKYELHSLPYITQFPKIQVIDKIATYEDITFAPWLVAEDWKKVQKIKSPYMFGHFELPKFKMNAMVDMPDHGMLNENHFINQKMVFSGHFHKRQNKGKIWYIGNCFPHNYSDVWDDDRGIMIWKNRETPEFMSWPNAPKFRILNFSDVLTDPESLIDKNTWVKINIDVPASYEDIQFVKELLENNLGAKEVQLVTPKIQDDNDDEVNIDFESVDSIVISHLDSIESNSIDKQKLKKIYQEI